MGGRYPGPGCGSVAGAFASLLMALAAAGVAEGLAAWVLREVGLVATATAAGAAGVLVIAGAAHGSVVQLGTTVAVAAGVGVSLLVSVLVWIVMGAAGGVGGTVRVLAAL